MEGTEKAAARGKNSAVRIGESKWVADRPDAVGTAGEARGGFAAGSATRILWQAEATKRHEI